MRETEVAPCPDDAQATVGSRATGKCLKNDEWTEYPDDALNLDSVTDALRACADHDFKDTEPVLRFGDNQYDMALSIC
ncbi:MAG TPA: hypothetical protein VK327_04820 [Candidatus Paceibacterota bacterium]|nr:hypothetical protein [Candidatus Paceibacterota bacterium]